MSRAFLTLGILLTALVATSGCGQKRVAEFKAAQALLAEDPTALDGEFQAQLTLCRRVGKKSWRPIGVGTEFEMKRKSRVEALLEVANVEPGEVNMFHLVWIKPGEKEVFRRYAEVRVEESETGYDAHIQYKKAENLLYLREFTQRNEDNSFRLKIGLNTSLEKERVPGTYSCRVYFNRELLLEETFVLTSA